MAVAMIGPKFYAWDRNGKPLAFGKLYTYQARTNTPKTTYQSEDQVVENTNPVILNGEGYANVYLDGSYKMVLKDDEDNEIWSSDPVSAAQATEWNNCQVATYVSSTSFRMPGNQVDVFEVGRRVRIDNNTSNYAYATIQSASFGANETTVEITSPVVTTGIAGVCVSIIGEESSPTDINYLARYSMMEFDTVADMISGTTSSGEKVEFSEGIKARTHFYNTSVICDWTWTQTPAANSISIALDSGWYAVLSPLLGVILTPEMVGAYGDFSQEDHDKIQTCLDYFENNQFYGTVKIDKNYLIGDTVSARSYANLDGYGVMKAKGSLNKPVFQVYAAYPVRKIQNTTYSNFTIDGNKANQTTTDPYLGAGMVVRADVENPFINGDPDNKGETENITLYNIKCDDCKVSGFVFGKNTFVTRSYSYSKLKANGAVYGMYIDDFCEYITFSDCDLQQNQYGVYDNGSSNLSFIGGTYANNTEAGIYLFTTGRNTSKKIINGIHINHNKRGVWLGSGVGTVGLPIDQIIITNNHLMANDAQGVVGSGGNDVIVKNNDFSGNGASSPGNADDIFIGSSCRRWDVDNKHINSTGDTRHAVYYENGAAAGASQHMYHKINGSFEGYSQPIAYLPSGDPTLQPLQANTNFIQGVFEYWNGVGKAPSATADNANASVDISKIPYGTICVNNGDNTGAERWRAVKAPSSSGANITVSFERVANYV